VLQLILLQYHQERDPIERVRKLLLAHDLATAAELKVRSSFGNTQDKCIIEA
jgi:TPP-dependent pyruvate/acetoin dehydrogenase alpha subunit